jgi:hypothetical protein
VSSRDSTSLTMTVHLVRWVRSYVIVALDPVVAPLPMVLFCNVAWTLWNPARDMGEQIAEQPDGSLFRLFVFVERLPPVVLCNLEKKLLNLFDL